MGERDTQQAEQKNDDEDLGISPMQVNLHGMIPFYRGWYHSRVKSEDYLIHSNFMDILDYLVRKYVPEYDEEIGVGNYNSDDSEEE